MLGGTGGTGRAVLPQALEAGHDVTAVVRNPAALLLQHPHLCVQRGSVMDPDAMDNAVAGQDAVISVLGTRRSPRGFGSFHLMRRTADALLPSMQRHHVTRLVVLSALGVGESAPAAPATLRLLFRSAFRAVGHDKAASEARIRATDLDWTIVYVPVLGAGPATGAYRHDEHLHVAGLRRISRGDVARFLLDQLADPRYCRRNVILST